MASNSTISIGFKIENGRDGFKNLITDAESLQKVLASTVTEAQKLEKRYMNFSAVAKSFSAVEDSIRQLGSVISDISGESNEFTTAMKAANTMAGKDAAGFSALKKEVTGLAKDIPLLREELAGGLYQVISNGVPEDNWISFLEASARSAVGGMADLGTAVTVTSTIIKNYGLEWDKAREIQDKIQLTAKNGVTSFEQLAAALPKVTGNAATLGVGIDELMASFATLTGVSGNTAEVATQMAAIFTALVKPSSEATKMAEEMGIRFDAAAIQAAGGFQNFIEQLKGDVQSFAQSSGMLEQTIYSRLFGSAESVRALIPLTGELSEKFAENVAAMKDSAGTMDAAFNEMATTGEAKTQLLKNAFAGVRDFFAGMISWALPLTSISSGALSTVANLMTLTNAFKKFGIAAKISNGVTNTLIFTIRSLGIKSKFTTNLVLLLSGAFDTAGRSAVILKHAVRGLLIASGVGLAITALTLVVEAFTGASEDAVKVSKEMEVVAQAGKRLAEMQTEAIEAENEARRNATSSMEASIAKLGAFNGSKEEEIRLVNEMNGLYGTQMGYFSTVAEWYDALIQNSKAYCDQMVAEAKTRKLADQIAELEIKRDKILYNEDGSRKMYSKKRKKERDTEKGPTGNVNGVATYSYREIVGSSEFEQATAQANSITRHIDHLRESTRTAAKELVTLRMPVMGDRQAPEGLDGGTPGKNTPVMRADISKESAPAGSIAAIEERISDIDKKVKFSVDPDEMFRLTEEKERLRKQIGELEIPIVLASKKEEWQKMTGRLDPLKLDVEVDTEGLTKELETIPAVLTPAEKLQQTLGTMSSVARQAGDAFRGMGQAFEIPALDFMGILAGAIATMVQSYAMAMSQAAALGPLAWVGFGLTGLATLTTMITEVKNVAKFADGGIVSGPTMALVGEYAGASNNPEVIAPLNKLKDIIGDNPASTPTIIGGRIEADGRKLAIVLENQTRISGKSGKRYKL